MGFWMEIFQQSKLLYIGHPGMASGPGVAGRLGETSLISPHPKIEGRGEKLETIVILWSTI